jgi:hypothetical protein
MNAHATTRAMAALLGMLFGSTVTMSSVNGHLLGSHSGHLSHQLDSLKKKHSHQDAKATRPHHHADQGEQNASQPLH